MKKNRNLLAVVFLFLTAAALVCLVGVLTVKDKEDSSLKIKKEKISYSKKNYHLADNEALYETQDNKSVETMYLTVIQKILIILGQKLMVSQSMTMKKWGLIVIKF